MYIPAPFRNDDCETAYALIEEIRLGSVISAGEQIEVSHLPFMIDRDSGDMGRLIAHCARANPQWRNLDGRDVLVTFLGPHTHVSPSWYGTHPRAPTWLYVSVHVRGRARLVLEPGAVRDMAVRLSSEMEPPTSGWSPQHVGDYIDRLLPGIVGFHVEITGIQTQIRLAQQNGMDDRDRVHRALRDGDPAQRLVARLMERFSFGDQPAADPNLRKTRNDMDQMAPIYRNLDQTSLDAQYNIRAQIPDHPEISRRWAANSERVRAALAGRSRIDIPFGSDPLQKLDLFLAETPNAPLLVFIHGGYWRAQDKSEFSYVAEPYVARGINVAVINYRLAPRVTMDDIVADVRAALAFLYRSSDNYGYARDRIFVSGSSAGGHLTVMALTTDWASLGLPADTIKGGCALSGLYELEPIRLCYLNKEIGLDAPTAERNSPLLHVPAFAPPLILSVGGAESAEFHRQQEDFTRAWRAAGLTCVVVGQSGGHHFDMIDRFADPSSDLWAAMQLMMRR
jgi:arylformamidase